MYIHTHRNAVMVIVSIKFECKYLIKQTRELKKIKQFGLFTSSLISIHRFETESFHMRGLSNKVNLINFIAMWSELEKGHSIS